MAELKNFWSYKSGFRSPEERLQDTVVMLLIICLNTEYSDLFHVYIFSLSQMSLRVGADF